MLPQIVNANTDLSALGVYNGLDNDYGGPGVCGMIPGGSDTGNKAALQAAISAAIVAGGGTVLIPDGNYPIQGTIVIESASTPPLPVSVVIRGTSGQTTLSVTNAAPLFQTDQTVGDGSPGVTIQDLHIISEHQEGNAINVVQGYNVRLLRVILSNFQTAVALNNTVGFSMLECTVHFSATTPADNIGFKLALADRASRRISARQLFCQQFGRLHLVLAESVCLSWILTSSGW
jgi:hypothetical protein